MNEDEGFTIVDEYLGVREASDGSDDESTSQVEATSKTSSHSTRSLPSSYSRYSNSRRRPTTAPIDIPASKKNLGVYVPDGWYSRDKEREERLAEAPAADPDEIITMSSTLNSGEAAEVPSVPISDNGMSSSNDGYPRASDHQPSTPSIGRTLEHLCGLTHPADIGPKNGADAGEECKPSSTTTEAGMANAAESKLSFANLSAVDKQLQDSIDCPPTDETPVRLPPSMEKSLMVWLVPGDCFFMAILPVEGASVSGLESEMQRKLELKERVRLTNVQVRMRYHSVPHLSMCLLFCLLV